VIKVTITSRPNAPYAHDLTARTHTIVSDVAADLAGGDTGPTPHEMLLMSVGTCGAMTIEMFAKRQGIPLTSVTVTVTEGTIADPDDATKQIPHIVETFELEGNLTQAQIDSLERVAKKCPVYKVLVGKKVVDATMKLVTPAASAAATPTTP
jgi:putative redox protein